MRRVVITGIGLVTPVGNDLETSWRSLVEGKSGLAGLFGRAVHVAAENAEIVRPRLEERLRDKNIAWESIGAVVPSLEDVFIALTGRGLRE